MSKPRVTREAGPTGHEGARGRLAAESRHGASLEQQRSPEQQGDQPGAEIGTPAMGGTEGGRTPPSSAAW